MKRLQLKLIVFLVGMVLLAGFLTVWSQSPESASEESLLPGSRPTIHAERFPSLQAAFDAVSPEGGMVVIPAGEFRINQPVVIAPTEGSI